MRLQHDHDEGMISGGGGGGGVNFRASAFWGLPARMASVLKIKCPMLQSSFFFKFM